MFIYQITLHTNEHIWIMRRGTMPRTWLYPARNNPQNTENEQCVSARGRSRFVRPVEPTNDRNCSSLAIVIHHSGRKRLEAGSDKRSFTPLPSSCPFSFPTDHRLWPASASLLSLESSRRIESHAGTDPGSGSWPRSSSERSESKLYVELKFSWNVNYCTIICNLFLSIDSSSLLFISFCRCSFRSIYSIIRFN